MLDSLNLKEKTISGVRWTGLNRGVQSGSTLLITVILARLLQPEDFGLIAIATIFIILIGFLTEFGSGSAIVHSQELGQKEMSSIFWFTLLVGVMTTVTGVLIAPLVSLFFGEIRLGPILMVLSFSFFFTSLYIVQQSILIKRLDFKYLYVVRIVCIVLSGSLAIILAYKGYGVWSLVGGMLVEDMLTAILLWFSGRWFPSWHFRWGEVRSILKFSMNYLGYNIVNFLSERVPHILIGKFLGTEALGFFTIAQRLIAFPVESSSVMANSVLFPVFSKIQTENIRIRELYLQAMKHIGFIVLPLMIGISITAPELIRVVFGEKWMPAIFLLQLLSFAGIIQTFIATNGVLYLSKGKTDIQFHMSLLLLFVTAASVYIGLMWGIQGATISYAAASVVIFYPLLSVPYSLVGLRAYDLFLTLKEVFPMSLIMAIPTLIIAMILRHYGIEPLLILTSCILTGVVIYFICSLVINRNLLTSFYEMMNLKT